MIRRIVLGLLLVGLIAVIYVGYKDWSARRAMLAGDVTVGPGEPLPSATLQFHGQTAATGGQPTMPVADTRSPDTPVGPRLAGIGRYEVYPQGNLTYRIDTSTGKSCVLFATKEEWQKPEVYKDGCASSLAQ